MSSLPTPPPSAQMVETLSLYEQWAETYDTDRNILQAIDDQKISDLFRQAFILLRPSLGITVTELGCGTGRNTVKLLDHSLLRPTIERINALDFSQAMLDKAQENIEKVSRPDAEHHTKVRCIRFDALNPTASTRIPKVDLVVATLVAEHLPLDAFFSAVTDLLKPGGVLVLTNMHSEMGQQSRAGFRDVESNTKFQGTSYPHTINEVIESGKDHGFTLDEPFVERRIQLEDIEVVGSRAKKWVDVKVWFGMVMQLKGERRSQAIADLVTFNARTEEECAEALAKAKSDKNVAEEDLLEAGHDMDEAVAKLARAEARVDDLEDLIHDKKLDVEFGV